MLLSRSRTFALAVSCVASVGGVSAAEVKGYDAFKTICADTNGEAPKVRQIARTAKWRDLTAKELEELAGLQMGKRPAVDGAWAGDMMGMVVWVTVTSKDAPGSGQRKSLSCSLYAPPGDTAEIETRMKADLGDNVDIRLQKGPTLVLILTKLVDGDLVGYSFNGSHVVLPSFNGGAKSDYFNLNILPKRIPAQR